MGHWVPEPLAALLPLGSSQAIDLPFDIIDYIFSLLRPHPGYLVACSKAHPVFSQIAERHLYYHIITHTGITRFAYSLEPSVLNKLLSETPRIAKYVRVLQIEFNYLCEGLLPRRMMTPYLEQIAKILSMFTSLECIMLPSRSECPVSWREDLPRSFRKAMEDCFRLPTLQEVNLGRMYFPLYLLENNANITSLSLFGSPEIAQLADIPRLQLKTLSVEGMRGCYDKTFVQWAKQHTVGLRALTCVCPCDKIRELFVNTLNKLDLSLTRESPYCTHCDVETGEFVQCVTDIPIDLSSLPHLQDLTIRADVCEDDEEPYYFISYLPAAITVVKTASSLQHLTIEIQVELEVDLDRVDFSPLMALAEYPPPLCPIDLYIHSSQVITRTKIVSLLADYGGLVNLIEEGGLVIHPGETAPKILDICSKGKIVQHPLCTIDTVD